MTKEEASRTRSLRLLSRAMARVPSCAVLDRKWFYERRVWDANTGLFLPLKGDHRPEWPTGVTVTVGGIRASVGAYRDIKASR